MLFSASSKVAWQLFHTKSKARKATHQSHRARGNFNCSGSRMSFSVLCWMNPHQTLILWTILTCSISIISSIILFMNIFFRKRKLKSYSKWKLKFAGHTGYHSGNLRYIALNQNLHATQRQMLICYEIAALMSATKGRKKNDFGLIRSLVQFLCAG